MGSEYDQGRKDICVQNMIKEGRISGFRICSRTEGYLGSEYVQGRMDIRVQNMFKDGWISGFRI